MINDQTPHDAMMASGSELSGIAGATQERMMGMTDNLTDRVITPGLRVTNGVNKLADLIMATERICDELVPDDGTPHDYHPADSLEWLEVLNGLLPPLMFEGLCDALEVCEVHIVDYRICADDLADCPAGAEAKVRLEQAMRGE